MSRFAIFLGRLCIGSLFVFSGVSKWVDWQGAEQGFLSVLMDWRTLSLPFLQNFFSSIIPSATTILTVVCVVEIVAGFFVILGIKTRFAAFLLLLFFLPLTILLHPFWFFDGSKSEMQLILFMKNVGILGGLFYLLVFGIGEGEKEGFSDSDCQNS